MLKYNIDASWDLGQQYNLRFVVYNTVFKIYYNGALSATIQLEPTYTHLKYKAGSYCNSYPGMVNAYNILEDSNDGCVVYQSKLEYSEV